MKRIPQVLLLAFILTGNSSCFLNFYKTTQSRAVTNTGKATTIDSLSAQRKDFIVHNEEGLSYYMSSLKLSDDQQSLACRLDTLAGIHNLHLKQGKRNNMRYKKNEAIYILNEVHLYLPADVKLQPGDIVLPLNKVTKIEIIEKDKQRTSSNHILSTVGVSLGAVIVVGAIVLATSSCPYVSAYDGNKFSLQGEVYSGAVYPQMAKDDYLPLKLQPADNGNLQIKISNELKEKQNTDLAELLVVTHNNNSKILADDKGNFYEIIKPEAPTKAVFSNQKNVTELVENMNDNKLLYFDDTLNNLSANNVTLDFNKPANVSKAKLLLNLKNTFWMDYVYGEMLRGLGTYYNTFMGKQYKKSKDELGKWANEQHMPLTVSVKTKDGWKIMNNIQVLGPAVNREIVVPVDLKDIEDELLQVKLSSGFMFWEIDYAAIDYSTGDVLPVTVVKAVKATDENGSDVLSSLLKVDEHYLEQPDVGNTATIEYPNIPTSETGKKQSYILHTRGYYTHYGNFKNKPDIAFLKQFKEPGSLSAFSLALFKKYRNATLNSFANH